MKEQILFKCPSHIDLSLDSRSYLLKIPTEREVQAGHPFPAAKDLRTNSLIPKEKVILADIAGPVVFQFPACYATLYSEISKPSCVNMGRQSGGIEWMIVL